MDEVEKRRARRADLDALKMERGGCEEVLDDGTRCGWNRHPAGLQWDHRGEKANDGGEAIRPSWAWARILAEVSKCDLVCACCHAIRTARRGYQGGRPMHGRPRRRLVKGEFSPKKPKPAQRDRSKCPKGHPYDETNTYIGTDGRRRCKACNAAWHRRRREERRAS